MNSPYLLTTPVVPEEKVRDEWRSNALILSCLVLALWAICCALAPADPSLHVLSATLNRLSLGEDSRLLSCDLSVDIGVSNPNRMYTASYGPISAGAIYGGQFLAGWSRLEQSDDRLLRLGGKNTTAIRRVFAAESKPVADHMGIRRLYETHSSLGAFDMELLVTVPFCHDFAGSIPAECGEVDMSCLLPGLQLASDAAATSADPAASVPQISFQSSECRVLRRLSRDDL